MTKIMIVDDDIEIAENLSLFLKKAGFAVQTRDNTKNLADDLVADPPDLVVLDVMFPGNHSDGFDAARLIRHRKEIADLPIILVTGINQEFPVDFSTKDIDPDWMPVQDFIEKPADPKKLIVKIEKILADITSAETADD